jgi:hypothetical protein
VRPRDGTARMQQLGNLSGHKVLPQLRSNHPGGGCGWVLGATGQQQVEERTSRKEGNGNGNLGGTKPEAL